MKRRLLAFFRVSEHPDPPPGGTEGLEIFRPSRRFLYYNFVRWLPKQINALIGLVFSLVLLGIIDFDFIHLNFIDIGGLDDFLQDHFGDVTVSFGPLSVNVFDAFHYLEFLAIGTFLLQFIVSGLLLRLAWELRWYMVGEEALRIRSGLWHLREQTMTIANIQNMSIRQGPIQKLFGIADLEIQTAGGGGKKNDYEDERRDHVGRFEGLENAEELREHLRSRLIRDRGTGLGDVEDDHEDDHHEDDHEADAPPLAASTSDGALAAARQLLEEARALRRAVGGSTSGS